jgi:hypothetical protein
MTRQDDVVIADGVAEEVALGEILVRQLYHLLGTAEVGFGLIA